MLRYVTDIRRAKHVQAQAALQLRTVSVLVFNAEQYGNARCITIHVSPYNAHDTVYLFVKNRIGQGIPALHRLSMHDQANLLLFVFVSGNFGVLLCSTGK